MKRSRNLAITFLSFILNIPFLFSQDYVPLAVEQATWVVGVAPDGFDDIQFHGFKIEGDTMVNSIQYKKVYYYDLEDNVQDPYQILSKSFYGIVRDDVAARKVYGTPGHLSDDCVSIPALDEVLLFDFAQAVEDTLDLCSLDFYDPMYDPPIVYLTDSIETHFGYDRRTLGAGAIELIEGIGSNQGPFGSLIPFTHAGWGQSLFYYCIGDNFNCGLHTAVSDLVEETDLKIYPNPTDSKLNIETDLEIKRIRMYNLLGELIGTEQTHQTVDIAHYNSGTYVMLIEFEDDKFFRKRVIKQ